MLRLQSLVCWINVLSFLLMACYGCDPEEMVRGCRIHEGICHCGMGCNSDFKYSNREECRNALKGKSRDVCLGSPCANRGTCTQVSSYGPRYRCRCEGTGYYGPRCQYACSSLGSGSVKVFPYECIVI